MQSSAYDKGSVSLTSSSILPVILGSPALSISALSPPYNKGGDTAAIIEAGAPDIQGTFTSLSNGKSSVSGAFTSTQFVSNHSFDDYYNVQKIQEKIFFDANGSSAIYGASNTIQPPAISLISQIKI